MSRRRVRRSAAWLEHLRNPPLRAAFGIGFCILFAFIGTFTYVNFVLVRAAAVARARWSSASSISCSCPRSSRRCWPAALSRRFGTRPTMWGALALAGVGLPLLLLPNLAAVLPGMVLVGVGTFFAQATATGFVGRAATADRGSASGIYLACYFFGGLVGSAVLGQIFDRLGWTACVAGIGVALAVAAALGTRLVVPASPR